MQPRLRITESKGPHLWHQTSNLSLLLMKWALATWKRFKNSLESSLPILVSRLRFHFCFISTPPGFGSSPQLGTQFLHLLPRLKQFQFPLTSSYSLPQLPRALQNGNKNYSPTSSWDISVHPNISILTTFSKKVSHLRERLGMSL